MSLRKIHKAVESEKGLVGSGIKPRHQSKPKKKTVLSKYNPAGVQPKPLDNARHVRFGPTETDKRIIPVLIITIAAIAVIFLLLTVWAPKEDSSMGGDDMDELLENTTQEPGENNTSEGGGTPVPIVPPAAGTDIEVTSLELSGQEAVVGTSIKITANVKNKGASDLTNISLSFSVGTSEIARRTIDLMPAQKTLVLSADWTPTEDMVGTHNIEVSIDPNNAVAELIETNNEKDVSVSVRRNIVEDVSAEFKLKSRLDVYSVWYSDKYPIPPKSGEDYKYFQISGASEDTYYLDVAITGFKVTKQNNISRVEVQDASDSGWNTGRCIREGEGTDCMWTGPMLSIDLSFKNSKIIATDEFDEKAEATSLDSSVKSIELDGIRTANWPEPQIQTFKIFGRVEPNRLIPGDFYAVAGNKIYIYPMRWNPKTYEAKVTTWLRFKVTTN